MFEPGLTEVLEPELCRGKVAASTTRRHSLGVSREPSVFDAAVVYGSGWFFLVYIPAAGLQVQLCSESGRHRQRSILTAKVQGSLWHMSVCVSEMRPCPITGRPSVSRQQATGGGGGFKQLRLHARLQAKTLYSGRTFLCHCGRAGGGGRAGVLPSH